MSQKDFLTDVNILAKLHIQRLAVLPAHAGSSDQGRIIYDTTSNQLYIGSNTAWVQVNSGAITTADFADFNGDVASTPSVSSNTSHSTSTGNAHSAVLTDLTNVQVPSPTNNHVLTYVAANLRWEALATQTVPFSLNTLTDTNAGSPSNGQTLTWNSATSRWIPSSSVKPIATKSLDYTVTLADEVLLVDTDSGDVEIDFPQLITAYNGKVYTIKNVGTSGNDVIINADSSNPDQVETISSFGKSASQILTDGNSVNYIGSPTDNTWWII